MPVSVQDILELNGRNPVLNRYVKFFSEEERSYAYLNRKPYNISFMELSSDLSALLQKMDGTKSINEILTTNHLDISILELFSILYKNKFLIDERTQTLPVHNDSITITFFPTTTCNLNCRYCYTNADDIKGAIIDVKKAEAWVDYTLENLADGTRLIKVLYYGGGEPTLAFREMKYIWNYIKARCEEKKLETRLSCITNGNFSAEVLTWFIEERAHVLFSIDGRKELHDYLRPRKNGNNSFMQAYNNFKAVGKEGLRPGIRATITGINIDGMKDLIDMAKEVSAGYVNLEPCSSYGRPGNLNETTVSVDEFIPKYIEAWKYGITKGIIVSGFPAISVQPGNNFLCNPWTINSLYLTTEGYLSVCTDVTVRSDKSSDVFFAGKIYSGNQVIINNKILQQLKQRNSGVIQECRECFMEYVCNSGCPAKAFRETGGLMNIYKEDCRLIQNISKQILKTLLYENHLFNASEKIKEFRYNHINGNDLKAHYISFFN